jgi:NADH:ubiquinone oxidoreductase subunit 5 (subunit L)/multisubunit Na+/H+ antiporter MnhA subunit
MALAVGAILAGFVGVPQALYGNNVIEHFLEPSFTARHTGAAGEAATLAHAAPVAQERQESEGIAGNEGAEPAGHGGEGAHLSQAGEIGLMALSVVIALVGIATAYRFYVRAPEIADRLAARWAGPHRVLLNKYYVDELYGATVIRGTLASASGLWVFDAKVVDGAVNGTGWLTIFSSWFSHLLDKYLVDGLVNLVGAVFEKGSFFLRKAQTGLVQNYALVMLFGVFAFVSLYLLSR